MSPTTNSKYLFNLYIAGAACSMALIFSSFYPILISCLVALIVSITDRDERAFSTISYFYIITFILIPFILPSYSETFFWGRRLHISIESTNIILATSAVLAGLALADALPFGYRYRPTTAFCGRWSQANVYINNILLAILFMHSIVFFNKFYQIRGIEKLQSLSERPFFDHLVVNLPQGIVFGITIISLYNFLSGRESFKLFITHLAFWVIINNPASTPRQVVFGQALAMLLLWSFLSSKSRKTIYWVFIIISVFFAAPIVSFLTREFIYQSEIQFYPYHPDFDVGFNFVNGLEFMRHASMYYGENLIKIFTSILPNEIKPFEGATPSVQVASHYGYYNQNISFPIFLAFYMDFGYLGVLLGMCFLSYGLRAAMTYGTAQRNITLILSVTLVGFSFSLLRGPLLGNSPFIYFSILGVLVAYGASRCPRLSVFSHSIHR